MAQSRQCPNASRLVEHARQRGDVVVKSERAEVAHGYYEAACEPSPTITDAGDSP